MLDSRKVASGSFGKVYENGVWLDNIYGFSLDGENSYEEIKRSGTRAVGHKLMSTSYSGSMSLYHTDNEFAKRINQASNDSAGAYFTELIVVLEDPENSELGREKIRVKGVQFTNNPVISYEHGSVSEKELQFVCEGYEFITV